METASLLIFLNLFGMFPGYLSYGWVADHLGRRKSFALYLFAAALLIPFYAMARSQGALLVLGAVVAFLRDRLVLWLRDHRQRNLPHKFARPWLGIYLHRRASDEFGVPVCDREDRRSERD